MLCGSNLSHIYMPISLFLVLVKWLQLGDQNNAFFRHLLKVINARNTISYLWDAYGHNVEDVERESRRLLWTSIKSFLVQIICPLLMKMLLARFRQLITNSIVAERLQCWKRKIMPRKSRRHCST
jgi:hypothetical protein